MQKQKAEVKAWKKNELPIPMHIGKEGIPTHCRFLVPINTQKFLQRFDTIFGLK